MASILLRSETAGICPNTDATLNAKRAGWQSSWRTGTVMRDAVNAIPRRVYGLRWKDTDQGEVYRMREAWMDSGGGALLMDYTPIGELDANSVEVSFVPESFTYIQRAKGLYDMAADVEERI